jgi:hypothetical protein
MLDASISHVFNGPRGVENHSRAEIIDVTARGFNILECEFRHSRFPYRDFAVTEIRI